MSLALAARAAEEIGFGETFALADDRAEALEQLIPGTRDYYYYTACTSSRPGKYDGWRRCWRSGSSVTVTSGGPRRSEPAGAAALPGERQEVAGFIQKELGLTFSHQQERLRGAGARPTRSTRTRFRARRCSRARFPTTAGSTGWSPGAGLGAAHAGGAGRDPAPSPAADAPIPRTTRGWWR